MKIMKKKESKEKIDRVHEILANIAEEWFKLCGWFLICATFGYLSNIEKIDTYIPDVFLGISYVIGLLYFYIKYFPPAVYAGLTIALKISSSPVIIGITTALFCIPWMILFIGFGKLVFFFANNIGPLVHG